jgi:putative tryptophan/tyrosine transport system substrate-binding protein
LGSSLHLDSLLIGEAQAAARKLGFEVATAEIRRAEDIAPAFATLKGRAEALYVVHEPLVFTHRVHINTSALNAHLPTMYEIREGVEAGGLMSYVSNFHLSPLLVARADEAIE